MDRPIRIGDVYHYERRLPAGSVVAFRFEVSYFDGSSRPVCGRLVLGDISLREGAFSAAELREPAFRLMSGGTGPELEEAAP